MVKCSVGPPPCEEEVKELWEECSVGVDVGGGPIIFLSEKVGVQGFVFIRLLRSRGYLL